MTTSQHDPDAATSRGFTASVRAAGRVSWAIIGVVIVAGMLVAAFAFTRAVSIPVVLAFVLAIVFQPVTDWLAGHRWPRTLAAATALLGMLVVVIGVIALVAGTLVDDWDEISSGLSQAATTIDGWSSNTSLSDSSASDTKDSVESSASTFATGIASGLASVFGPVAGAVAGLFIGLWVAFYVLQGGYLERTGGENLPVSESRAKFRELAEYARTTIRGFYASQTALGVFDGVLIALAMVVMGIPGAVAVGVATLIGSYIPYIGAFIPGALAVLLALADGGVTSAVIILVVVLLVQNTMQNLVQPRITSHWVTLSPLAVLLATTFGGVVAGLIGLVLAVPFTAIAFEAVKIARRPSGSGPALATQTVRASPEAAT